MKNVKPRGIKAPLHLLPFRALCAVSSAMQHGALKYKPWNWTEQDGDWRELYSGALARHVGQYIDPTEPDVDEESGLNHLALAGACVLILLWKSGVGYVAPRSLRDKTDE